MSLYDPSVHHRQSIRLPAYGYTQAGAYFITICANNRRCLFGDIVDSTVKLSPIGGIVKEEWEHTAVLRPNVRLDAYVIMPNHFHAVLFTTDDHTHDEGHAHRAPTDAGDCGARDKHTQRITAQAFGKPVAGSIAAIVGGFKSAVTSRVRGLQTGEALVVWQRNYYEHVVRDEEDFARLQKYVAQNPLQWELDQLHPNNPSKW